ncbi:baseplate wedge subunit [Cyanophage S-TIM4]|uniref:Base plate wedge subunit n=2 Tax=Thaumasvirus stim4 TaxID=2734148 RepID=A0A345AWF2_9CAUD|nr:baseplate wedge subunit [Prochlorococcus phage P-RSM4]YP_009806356.1 baseplate wedge subunit [Cyanophage S-TIM4]ADO98488.1 base plate wedge subunit [Prochlorococcus phage P-RSM4]AXF41235.1 base plate wedge subunit [Cyanophage S-TIM4]|tara:strand:+ start:287 stop:706 length:420 start_codon:yes stop_codon:yes gene_type:complete
MALKKISGKDQKRSRSFTDLSLGMVKNANTQDVAVVKNDNAIKQAIKNLIMTTPGEKPFQPLVGSNISKLLFEPLDDFTSDAIKQEIINTINRFEPRVRLTGVRVQPRYDRNTFNVTIVFKIVGIPINETIEFVLQRPE